MLCIAYSRTDGREIVRYDRICSDDDDDVDVASFQSHEISHT